jgi:hypothetical protein
MHRTLTIFDPRNRALAMGLRPFFRVDVFSHSGHLLETHYVAYDDVLWC